MKVSRTLLGASLLGLASSLSAAASFSSSSHKNIHALNARSAAHIKARDASTQMSGGDNNEGEDHKKITAPEGSIFTSIPVGDGGEEIAAFWSDKPDNSSAKHAFIMIHGRLRDGDAYWETMNTILQKAIDDKYPGASDDSIVVAPQFFSTKYNKGQFGKHIMAWGDVNAWQAGEGATHPSKTKLTSFDAMDALVDEFLDSSKYPKMQNITVVGHGGGGQLGQRYAMVAKSPSNTDIHIRYIHGDPSSCAYFTKHRPKSVQDSELPKKSSCKEYNTWRYGFDNFTGTADGLKTPKQYFQQYISRDVISIVGYEDVKASGDTYCMARIQGGTKRRDRNLAWWQYVNTLARTNEDLDGFPATFGKLPDWSDISNNQISMRLTVVEHADHDAEAVFSGQEGRAALFGNDVPTGWRPAGWKPATPVRLAASGSSSSSSTPASTYSAPVQKNASPQRDSLSVSMAAPSMHTNSFYALLFGGMCLTLLFSF